MTINKSVALRDASRLQLRFLLHERTNLLHAVDEGHVHTDFVLPLMSAGADMQIVGQLLDHAHHGLLLAAIGWVTTIILPIAGLQVLAKLH